MQALWAFVPFVTTVLDGLPHVDVQYEPPDGFHGPELILSLDELTPEPVSSENGNPSLIKSIKLALIRLGRLLFTRLDDLS